MEQQLMKKEDITMQLRDKLRNENIKLWMEPYYTISNGANENELIALANRYSENLKLTVDDCYQTLKELQNNSLENLKQSHHYKESGMATLKIKLIHPNSQPHIIKKEVSLLVRAYDLKQMISTQVGVNVDRLKLISAGKVLEDNINLVCQGVKNGQQILSIVLDEQPLDTGNPVKELEDIKRDSRMLALDQDYMTLEDQFGNPIKVPREEKRALIVAMALHEKGRAALKKSDYLRALVFLLEADQEFRQCTSKLLESVDNYALLDLDIAWCYLMLQSISNLPEAYERLKRCENRFHATYGPNLERLIAIKGVTGNEAPLFLRLHLLQGIALYHQNRRKEALELFNKVKEELKILKVDENSLLMLIELGYSVAEARLGLRANQGDVNAAANYINENRDKRKRIRKQNFTNQIMKKERLKLGKCADGKQYVDPNFVKILVNMGYNKEAARVGLSKTNNIISDAIQYIEENPVPGPSHSKSTELINFVNDLAIELEAAGFDLELAKLALRKHMGDIMKAVDELLTNNAASSSTGTNTTIESQSNLIKSEILKKMETESQKEEAFKRLTEDLSMVDDDHLDLSLDEEEVFLRQYLNLLE